MAIFRLNVEDDNLHNAELVIAKETDIELENHKEFYVPTETTNGSITIFKGTESNCEKVLNEIEQKLSNQHQLDLERGEEYAARLTHADRINREQAKKIKQLKQKLAEKGDSAPCLKNYSSPQSY